MLTVFGLVLAFSAFEALSQASAETRAEARPPHASSRTQGALPGRSGASRHAAISHPARSTRTRRLPHHVTRPHKAPERPYTARRRSHTAPRRASRPPGRRSAARWPYDPRRRTARHGSCGTRAHPADETPTHLSGAPVEGTGPRGVRTVSSRPLPAEQAVAPARDAVQARSARPDRSGTGPYRLTSAGPVTDAPPPRTARIGVPPPVPDPGSGCGGGGCATGKTPSGVGDVVRIGRPRSGVWTVMPRTSRRPGRDVPDKPPFSPD
ncbi:hypothetical protein OG417_03155 [Actinoallomurus sp. NBC_01490]|uniref:hypothetical protein n=1 Tax=Actinoallomurus sp. NBC_01490 TaxID=2903557 RepID=UPI002E303162|nr:hypothetical protein [Actinoallomurus sp. NBC_01490]